MAKTEKKVKKPFQFLNSFYFRARWDKRTRISPDYLVIVYKDETDGKKKLMIREEPVIKFYMAKDDVPVEHHLNYLPLKDVDEIKCKYSELPLALAQIGGAEDVYYSLLRSGKSMSSILNTFHQQDYIFGSDINIEDYYKGLFLDSYAPTMNKFSKGYTDIEVDSIDIAGFPNEELAPCPVNALTFLDGDSKTFYTLLLRNEDNPQIEELEGDLKGFKRELKERFGKEFTFKLKFFDGELDLIMYYFELINTVQPDFTLIWNMRFDILTLINRITKLGGNVLDICHPDFNENICRVYFNKDGAYQKASDKWDWFECSTYTQHIDQLNLYASLRKELGEKESYSLNAIAKEELGDSKLDYSDISDIKNLPYTDYRTFVIYNIKDVHLLYELECKNEDVEMLINIADTTRTRLNKAMRKTISLKNMAYKFYLDQGYVMGNNNNIVYKDRDELGKEEEADEKFSGAFVASPLLNDYCGMFINGKKSKFVYQKVIDMDLAQLYPSIIMAYNIDATTQYGRLAIDGKPPTKEYDPAGDFIDNLECQNPIELGKKWFNLPSIADMVERLQEKIGG